MMASSLLSECEREYIVSGVAEGVRADGRGCKDVRHFSLQTDVVSNTNGSAKIQLDRTSAIIGVKAELGVPQANAPDAGRIEFFVDCSALASPAFERREGEELGHFLAHRLQEAYKNDASIDLSSLKVISGQQCWVLYVDALVLEWGGSVIDTLSIGVRAALQTTSVPCLTVTGEGEELEIEVSDNPFDSTPVDAHKAPVIITLTQVGTRFVVDSSLEEEMCSDSRLSLAINADSKVVSINKDGTGGIPYKKMNDLIEMGQNVAKQVLETMNTSLHSKNTDRTNIFT